MLRLNVSYFFFLIPSLFIGSCQGVSENQEMKKQKEVTVNDSMQQDSIVKSTNSTVSKELFRNLELFAQQLQGDDLLKINFYPNQDKTTEYMNYFTQNGLEEFFGYANKKVDRYRQISYPQMNLFIAKYSNIDFAKNAFELLKEKTRNKVSSSVGDLNADKDRSFTYEPKHGGFIFQEDVFVISLVKVCSGNPLQLSWAEYENTFLKTLQPSKDTLEIIYSTCGDGWFKIIEKEWEK